MRRQERLRSLVERTCIGSEILRNERDGCMYGVVYLGFHASSLHVCVWCGVMYVIFAFCTWCFLEGKGANWIAGSSQERCSEKHSKEISYSA